MPSDLSQNLITNIKSNSIYLSSLKKKTSLIDTTISTISGISGILESYSLELEEEQTLHTLMRRQKLQGLIHQHDNSLLAAETEYLATRLAIVETKQKLELALLEKKFQWEFEVQQMQKKYNIQAKTLNLDNSTQTSINTYNQSIDLGDTRVSWDHPPFDPVNPSYNSCNSIHKPQQHPPSSPRSPSPSAQPTHPPAQPTHPPAQPTHPPANLQKSPSQHLVPLRSPSPSAQPKNSPAQTQNSPSQNPSPPISSQVQSVVPSRRHTITSSNPSNQQDQRLSSVTLEQQLREAIQERFKNANPNSDDESNSDLSEEDF